MTVVVGGAGQDRPGDPPAGGGGPVPPTVEEDPTRAAIAVTASVIGVVRLFGAALAVPALFAMPSAGAAAAGLALSVLMAVVLTRRPEALTATTGRRALLLGADLAVGAAVYALAGFGIPCLYQTLGTAALAAALHGVPGVAVGAAAGMAASVLTVLTPPFGLPVQLPLAIVVAIPTSYALVALVAALVRHLYRDQVQLRQSLRTATWQAAQAQERARLARELHDSLAKTLSGIGLYARAVQQDAGRPARVDELAGEIAAAADEATVQARAMIAGLRETASPDLTGAIRTTVAAWERSHPATVELLLAPVREPDAGTRRELVAVLGEALANVRRHADASRVRVELAEAGGALRLTVRDDGRGFAVPEVGELARAGRYGLVGMTERLDGVRGTLTVRSRAGIGTTLVAEVPVTPPTAPAGPGPAGAGSGAAGTGGPAGAGSGVAGAAQADRLASAP